MIVKDGVLIKVEESDIVNGTFSSWEGITSIGEGAFSSLHNLIEIEIPPKIKEIKDGTFVVCSILKKVVLPPQLEKIGNNAFKQCTRLKELDIPKTVTSIGEYAFMYCFEMKEIKIPEGVRTIEKSTFEYCPSLEKIVFTKKMEKIDNSAFMSCKNVNTLEFKEGLDITNINIIDNFENLKTMIIQDKEFDFSKYKQFIIDDVEKCRKQIIKMQLLLDENFKMNSLIKFPIAFLDSFDKENLQMILTKKNQKHFKQIYNECIKDKKNYIENLIDFYKFAYSIGCFNDEEIVIDSKKINLAQKASVFLKQILDDNIFSISDSHYYFDSLILCKYNPELLKFMTHKKAQRMKRFVIGIFIMSLSC